MSRQLSSSSCVVSIPAALAMLFAAGQAHGQAICPSWPIALTGAPHASDQYGPNQGPAYFTDLTSPNSNISRSGASTGMVIFRGDTNLVGAVGTPGSGGLWTWQGTNNKVVQISDPAPITGSYTTGGLNNPIVNDAGQFAFRDNTATTGAMYSNPGTMGRLLKPLDVAPGTGGATFSTFTNNLYMNASGSSVMLAGLTVGSGSPVIVANPAGANANNRGYWGGTPGALSLLVYQGDQLYSPSNIAVTDVQVGTIDGSAFAYNDGGKLLWTGDLQGAAVNTTAGSPAGVGVGNSKALMSTRSGFQEVIARRGDSFPDATGATFTSTTATDGVCYRTITTGSALDMNNAGRVVYSASLRTSAATGGALPTTGGTIALFSDNNGTLRTIARETQPLPAMTGLGTGLNWGVGFGANAINGANTIAFVSSSMTGTDPATGLAVTSAANSGLFTMDSAGTCKKILRSNDPAPASSAVSGNPALGQNAGTVLFSGVPTAYSFNALGQIAFVDGLTGTGIVTGLVGNNSALFGVDTDGSICTIAQKGMLFHVGAGDDRIVSSISFTPGMSGGQDGRASNLDDLGNIVFSLSFSDTVGGTATSSGVFYAHIPAPGSAALLGLGGLLAARRRRIR
jgi:MYXO-CTERM domain-containing protein